MFLQQEPVVVSTQWQEIDKKYLRLKLPELDIVDY